VYVTLEVKIMANRFVILLYLAIAGVGTVDGAAFAFPHIADGGSWKTIVTIINLADQPRSATLFFWSNNGNPLTLPVVGIGPTPGVNFTLAAHGVAIVETAGIHSVATQVGWASVISDFPDDIDGSAVFKNHISDGVADQEAAVPLTRIPESDFVLPFDNTAGFATGIALANPAGTPQTMSSGTANALLIVRDEAGSTLLFTNIQIAQGNHLAFSLADQYPVLANKRGSLEVQLVNGTSGINGAIAALGLRFTPLGSLTSVQPLLKGIFFCRATQ
jgi:hypothetical protein